MPDMEMLTRDLEMHLAKEDTDKKVVAARHEATDKARWEIVIMFALATALALLIIGTLVLQITCSLPNDKDHRGPVNYFN